MNFFTKYKNQNKLFLIIIAVVLIVLDVYFAYTSFKPNPNEQFPTFSKLYYNNQGQLLWFTYLFGCLTGKIFYNTYTNIKKQEIKGLSIIGITTLLLFILGKIVNFTNVPSFITLLLLIVGTISANLLWPQYKSIN
jgi:predicted branched-subunit amino acid permease